MLRGLSENQLLAVTIAVVFVTAGGLAGLGYYLEEGKLAPLRQKIHETELRITEVNKKIREIPALEIELKEQKLKVKPLKEALPVGKKESALALNDRLALLVENAGVRIQRVSLEGTQAAGAAAPAGAIPYTSPMTLSLEAIEGGVFDLGYFLYLLETDTRFLRVERFEINKAEAGAPGQLEGRQTPCKMNVRVTAYSFDPTGL